ncbi:MAG: C_GCAxxG_C_C family protein [Desulfobacteraceae bacterium]|nr:C_GCAxxG_C_C family protein [Desulfobacteraceae bacterium]
MNLNRINQYNDKMSFIDDIYNQIFETEIKYHGCSQVIVQSFLDVFEENNPLVSMASSPFAAGMALTGNNCGALIGGLMTLGMVYGRREIKDGMDGILLGIRPMRKLVKHFESHNKHLNCRDITQINMANPEQATVYFKAGGLEKCATIMAETGAFVAGMIYDDKENLQ